MQIDPRDPGVVVLTVWDEDTGQASTVRMSGVVAIQFGSDFNTMGNAAQFATVEPVQEVLAEPFQDDLAEPSTVAS